MRINIQKQLPKAMEKVANKIQLLHQEDSDLRVIVNEIKNLADKLKSSSDQGVTRLEYFKNQFRYLGDEQAIDNFLKLKIPRGNSSTKKDLIQLQIKIQEFIAKFLDIPQTNFVLFYEDEGEIHRADIPSDAPDKIINAIYSKSNKRVLHLDKKAKELLKQQQYDITITQHFNNYASATKELLIHKKGLQKRKKTHNMGHIAESFERHWQESGKQHNQNDWTNEELMRNYFASKGNVAWWRAGDVRNKQVKYLSDNGSVKTGSFTSIQELTNYILWLADQPIGNQSDLKQLSESIAKAFVDSKAINEYPDKTLAKLLAPLSKIK